MTDPHAHATAPDGGAGADASAADHAPASALAREVHAALSGSGPLARALPGFRARPAQQALAEAVASAFEDRAVLLAEAGTGTGKTFAYLVPALLSGRRTIVSTGTRALQDQLYHRDLPRVRDALGTGLRTALLKGRANYLCRHRLERARGESRFQTPAQAEQFQRIVAWGGRTRMGDLAELESLSEDSPLLPMVTSTADNCLGSECPFWSECFVVQARQRAQEADVVVVNHHLLLADLALREEGFGEVLPGAAACVVDEAHQLPERAAQVFGAGLSARSPNAARSPARWRRCRPRRRRSNRPPARCARRWRACPCAARARSCCPCPAPRTPWTPSMRPCSPWPRRWRRWPTPPRGSRPASCGRATSAGGSRAGAATRAGATPPRVRGRARRKAGAARARTTMCAGTNSPRAASACSGRRWTCPGRCARTASARARPGCSLRPPSRWRAASTTWPRGWAWTRRAPSSCPARSTGPGRRCATCRRACRSPPRATTPPPSPTPCAPCSRPRAGAPSCCSPRTGPCAKPPRCSATDR